MIDKSGPVAQWITRLPTEQEIPGSSPGRLGPQTFFFQDQSLNEFELPARYLKLKHLCIWVSCLIAVLFLFFINGLSIIAWIQCCCCYCSENLLTSHWCDRVSLSLLQSARTFCQAVHYSVLLCRSHTRRRSTYINGKYCGLLSVTRPCVDFCADDFKKSLQTVLSVMIMSDRFWSMIYQ